MPLSYGFRSLDETQLQRRRHLLDFYGQAAQLSALLVLLSYQIIYVVRLFLQQLRPSPYKHTKDHASPIVSHFQEQSLDTKQDRISIWRRFNWFLDQDVSWAAKSSGWGTWRVILIASIWTIWLSVLAVKDTDD
ncbi:MAG: hypothetical protein L6R42_007314, partial [Xanthoria sp. 1 TBL-2021]